MVRRDFLRLSLSAGTLVAMPQLCTAAAPAELTLRNRERIVFLGDSITEQRLYTTYVECFLLARYPTRRLTFRNAGWGGDTAWLRQRTQGTELSDAKLFMAQGSEQESLLVQMVSHGLARDVLSQKPTLVMIDFGMNDARRGDTALPIYHRSIQELVDQLRKMNVRVALLTPSPEERNQEGQPAGSAYNHMLEKYSEVVKEIAEKENIPFADQFHPYINVVERARRTDPAFKTMPDGVHPFPSGHMIMAWAILKGLGVGPIISEVTIDANQRNSRALRSTVTDLDVSNGVVRFTRTDQSMVLPLPSEAASVLPHVPIVSDLCRYTLRVTGLTADQYDVIVDGQPAVRVERAELEAGWDLTTAGTAIAARAAILMQKVVDKNNAYFARWRQIQLPAMVQNKLDDPDVKAKLDDADRRVAQLESDIDMLRRPVPHRFEIKPSTAAS